MSDMSKRAERKAHAEAMRQKGWEAAKSGMPTSACPYLYADRRFWLEGHLDYRQNG